MGRADEPKEGRRTANTGQPGQPANRQTSMTNTIMPRRHGFAFCLLLLLPLNVQANVSEQIDAPLSSARLEKLSASRPAQNESRNHNAEREHSWTTFPRLAKLTEKLPQLFLDAINSLIQGEIRPKRIWYEAPATLHLRDVEVIEPGGQRMASVESATLDVAVTQLLLGRVRIERLSLERPQVFLKMVNDELNVVRTFTPKDRAKKQDDGDGSNLTISIHDISVNGGHFSYRDADVVDVAIENISGQANIDISLGTAAVHIRLADVRADSGLVRLPELDVPLSDLFVPAGALQDLVLSLEAFEGKAMDARIRGKGSIEVSENGQFHLRGVVQAPPNAWPARLPPLDFSLPSFDASVELLGPLRSPTIKSLGHFNSFSPYLTQIDSGDFDVTITTTDVQIASATAKLPEGKISTQGLYHIEDQTIYLRVTLDQVPLKQALAPAELDTESSGSLSGNFLLNGAFRDNEVVTIDGDFVGKSLSAYGVVVPKLSRIRGNVQWSPTQTELKNIRVTGDGYRAQLSGVAKTNERRLALEVNGEVSHPEDWYPDVPEELSVEQTKFTGQIAGPFEDVHVELELSVSQANLWGLPLRDAETSLWVDTRRLEARDVKGRVAEGVADGTLAIRFDATNTLAGQLHVTRAQLSAYAFDSDDEVAINGQLNARAILNGSVEAPSIQVSLEGNRLAYAEENLGRLQGQMQILGEKLLITEIDWQLDGISLQQESPISLEYEGLELAGDLHFRLEDETALKRRWKLPIQGRAEGTIRFGGSISRPAIRAVGGLEQVQLENEMIGSGPFYVRVTEENLSAREPSPLWLQISSDLSSPQGKFQLRSTYSISEQQLHAVVDVGDVPIERWTTQVSNLTPIEGEIYGQLVATGPVDALNARVNLRLAKARLPLGGIQSMHHDTRGSLFLENAVGPPAYRPMGDVRLSATLMDSELHGYVCALSWNADAMSSPCEGGDLELRFDGTLDQKQESYDIELQARFNESRVQDWTSLLQTEQVEASIAATGNARVWGDDFTNTPRVEGRVRLLEAAFTHPDMLPTKLAEFTDISFRESEFSLENPLQIEVGTPEANVGGLKVTGRANADEVDVLMEGNIELALLQVFTRDITHASGRVAANIWFQGSLQAPRVAGVLTPENGASISLRSLQERFEFNGGSLELEPLAEVGTGHLIRASQLQVALGGGSTKLDGILELDAAELFSNGRFLPMRYAMEATGSSVTLGHRNIWGESSFQLRFESNRRVPLDNQLASKSTADGELTTTGAEPLAAFRGRLSGRVELSDGLLRERFEMTNFVLEARPDTPSEPLANQILRLTELDEIDLDVDLAVQTFQVRADLVSFLTTTQLSGDLRLENTLTIPNLVGAIEVVDGSVRFPKTQLEFTEARVEFPRERVGLNPRIFVSARGELGAQPPVCTAEIPIVLTLEGEDLNQVQMNLEAEESDLRHTRTELLSAVLLGQQLPRCSDGAGSVDPDVALRAVVSGLTSTLRKGIERFVADKTGSDLQLDLVVKDGRVGTDLRWKLSKRLQVEGGTGFGFGEDGANSTGSLGSSAFARFLILDHFPVSGDLFVEGGFSSTDSAIVNDNTAVELKLTYRVFGY